jgi:hypothetical protein
MISYNKGAELVVAMPSIKTASFQSVRTGLEPEREKDAGRRSQYQVRLDRVTHLSLYKLLGISLPRWKGGTPGTAVIGKRAFEFPIHKKYGEAHQYKRQEQ